MTKLDATPSRSHALGPAVTFGFGGAVAMWCVWWVSHHPAVNLAPAIAGPLLLATLFFAMIGAGRAAGPAPVWLVGGLAGLIAACLDLLVLGSLLARPPQDGSAPAPGFEGLTPSALVIVPGFLGIGILVGAIGGFIGGATRAGPSAPPPHGWTPGRLWLSRFAIVAAVSVIPLLLLGGAVTSTASGMAVPGWPDSYGANMFLYPIKLMSHPRVFLEHTHRLMGSLVGLTTLTLMLWTFACEARRSVKLWALAAFVLVCVQGVLGGVRVNETSVALAFAHGVTAQLFLALMVCFACFLSPAYELAAHANPDAPDRRRRAFCMGLQHATILQLLLGAAYRHFGQAGGHMHTLWTHAAFSLVVVGMAITAGFMLRARSPLTDPLNAVLRRVGTGLLAVVAIQFLLGWAAFFAVLHGGVRGPAPQSAELATAKPVDLAAAVITTLHQGNGALLLALATIGVVLTRRVWQNRQPAQAAPAKA